MPSAFGVKGTSSAGLGGQDTTQLLQKILFNRIVGTPAFGTVSGLVVSVTASSVVVTIDGLVNPQGTPTVTCLKGPYFGNATTPGPGTPCLVAFAENGAHTAWLVACAA